MSENHLDHKEIGNGVSHSLVDQVDQAKQVLSRGFLRGGTRFVRVDDVDGFVGEEDGAVAISFKVNTNVVSLGSVVEVFDAGGDTPYGKALKRLMSADVCGELMDDSRCTVGIASNYHSHMPFGQPQSSTSPPTQPVSLNHRYTPPQGWQSYPHPTT
jgi:hypothetical protein